MRAALLLLLLAAAPARAADHLTVLLDWFVNPDHAPLLAAQQIGAYAAEGLDVTLVPATDGTLPPKLVAAGDGDVALTDEPHFLQQVAAGLDLVRFGVLIDHPLSSLVALRGTGVTKLADLRGKRIGTGPGAAERAMLATVLHTAGLTLDDVQLVQLGEQLTVALLSHQVDAVTVYRNVETLELQAHGATPLRFDYESYGVPPFDELIFVARTASAGDIRLPRFLRATERGAAYLRAHPEESWAAAAQTYPSLDNALSRQSWLTTIPYFATDMFKLDNTRYGQHAIVLHR